MKLIPKHQNGSELIKRKQAFLKANGVNVKVDGRWGKWQQEQYNKLTEKDKHYNTTPLGFLSYLYDKTLGEGTTYHEDPQLVTGYTGEIKSDDRSAAKRWLSQQMNDNSTPLGYITQTVAPAAATAGAIVYGGVPLLNATGHGIKAVATNPQAALQTVKALPKVIKQAAPSLAKTFAKETAKGLAGASAVNVGSKLTTGKTWGQHVGELTGLSESAAEFTNPGWFVSPIYSGTKSAVSTLKDKTSNYLFSKGFNTLGQLVNRGPSKTFKTIKRQYNRPKLVNYQFLNDLNTIRDSKTFLARRHQPYTEIEYSIPEYKGLRLYFPLEKYSVPGNPALSTPDLALRESSTKFRQQFQNLLGNDGIVSGSTIGAGRGWVTTQPNDVEVITTRSLADKVKQKLNWKYNRTNSIGGESGTSEFATHSATPTVEFDYIEEKNGHAVGTLAHQIYAYLHPNEYAKLHNSILSKSHFKNINTHDIELPISADQLFAEFKNTPNAADNLHLLDILSAGANSFNPTKQATRAYNILLNPEFVDNVSPLLRTITQRYFGVGNKLPSEMYPKLNFSSPEQNKQFLHFINTQTQARLIPENLIDQISSNPSQMQNLFNAWYQQNLIGHRAVSIPAGQFTPASTFKSLFRNISSQGGGVESGGGLNHTTGAVVIDNNLVGSRQFPITYFPERIKTLEDFIKQYNRIQDRHNVYNQKWISNSPTISDLKRILSQTRQADIPIVRGDNYNQSYLGSFMPIKKEDIFSIFRQTKPEVGYALTYNFGKSLSKQDYTHYAKDPLIQNIPNWRGKNIYQVEQYLLDNFGKFTKNVDRSKKHRVKSQIRANKQYLTNSFNRNPGLRKLTTDDIKNLLNTVERQYDKRERLLKSQVRKMWEMDKWKKYIKAATLSSTAAVGIPYIFSNIGSNSESYRKYINKKYLSDFQKDYEDGLITKEELEDAGFVIDKDNKVTLPEENKE